MVLTNVGCISSQLIHLCSPFLQSLLAVAGLENALSPCHQFDEVIVLIERVEYALEIDERLPGSNLYRVYCIEHHQLTASVDPSLMNEVEKETGLIKILLCSPSGVPDLWWPWRTGIQDLFAEIYSQSLGYLWLWQWASSLLGEYTCTQSWYCPCIT